MLLVLVTDWATVVDLPCPCGGSGEIPVTGDGQDSKAPTAVMQYRPDPGFSIGDGKGEQGPPMPLAGIGGNDGSAGGPPSSDGRTIRATWEKSPDGASWEHDFDLVYTKARSPR